MTEPTPPAFDAERAEATVELVRRAVEEWGRVVAPVVLAAAEAIAKLGAQLREAGPTADSPTHPRDRPAWRSPYGPAHTRRRSSTP